MSVQSIAFKAVELAKRNAGKILTGVSIGGLALTSVLSAKGAKRIAERLNRVELPEREVKKLKVRSYTPAVLTGLGTAAAIVGIEVLGERKAAAITAAYALVAENYKLYRKTNIDINGENADEEVLEAMESKMLDDNYGIEYISAFSCEHDDILHAKYPKELFFEPITGEFFRAPMSVFLDARYHLGRTITNNGFASHADFLSFLGIGPETDPYPTEYDLGWDVDYLYDMTGQFNLDILTKLENRPEGVVNVIQYNPEPVTHYDGLG